MSTFLEEKASGTCQTPWRMSETRKAAKQPGGPSLTQEELSLEAGQGGSGER